MANKRRPKKTRAPYKRYVYKSNNFLGNSDDEEEDHQIEESQLESTLQESNNTRFKNGISVRSIYVLSEQVNYAGKIWPWSKFEKIDVLQCAIHGHNPDYTQLIEEEVEQEVMKLPTEIFVRIFEILQGWGKLKPKYMRVCKLFYMIILPMIYKEPYLRSTNFFSFVETISNNKYMGSYIRTLDLSYIIQSGKNAFVSKLLKRSGKNLEVFVAPQTSFGLGPLMSLKNCLNLKVLDLGLVSETLNLEELFKSIRNLNELTQFSFPRSSIEISDYSQIKWPPKLTFLKLSGGINDDFLYQLELPASITHMEFAHCPSISDMGFSQILYRIGRNLKTLKVQYPMPGLKMNSLDNVFQYCPNLRVLEISVDYVSSTFFDEQYLQHMEDLKVLYINSSGMLGTSTRLDPIDLAVAISDGRLPSLKHIQCTAKLGWNPKSEAVEYIADELDERNGGIYIGY
ncbi:hypothetical protein SBY92_005085 [Candida maltosa Xu316]|uniref:F-box domain-containing protein n=1 Tax=Candida maltosa (strain Xu316) TaxID=1245528 RepID=M3JXT3_CANMX|nr:hypothetical protein G210_1759 [Candida maltosa Xu316]